MIWVDDIVRSSAENPSTTKNFPLPFYSAKVLTNSLYLVKVEIVILLLYQFSELKQNDRSLHEEL